MTIDISYEERRFGLVGYIPITGLMPNNTLNREMLGDFLSAMLEASEKADAMLVYSTNEKFFSNGLDGATLLGLSPSERRETVVDMITLYRKLFSIEKPWVAEIAGHAMAGGAVISTAADNRFMLANSGRIGFSEMLVGMPLPASYVIGFSQLVQPKFIREIMYGGAYKPEDAKEIGLIDDIAPDKETLRKMSLSKLDSMLRLYRHSFLMTRNLYRGYIVKQMESVEANDVQSGGDAAMSQMFAEVLENIAKRNR